MEETCTIVREKYRGSDIYFINSSYLPQKSFDMKNITTRQVINILIIIVMLIFVGQNLEPVEVKFLVFPLTMPKVILITIIFLIGYLVAVFSRKSSK